MFDKKERPKIKVSSVIEAIKKDYSTPGGYFSKITKMYINEMIKHEKNYLTSKENFYNLTPVKQIDEITNKIAIYFYDEKIVKKKVNKIYNSLLQYNHSLCPVCGAHADTLDHVLPKNEYTQYTITPINLVPLCSRCNRKKLTVIYTGIEGESVFHPYFNDFHQLDGLTINFKINRKGHFIPLYGFEGSADKCCVYNFEKVFKLNEVLVALAVDEIAKLSRVLLTKTIDTDNLKPKAKVLLESKRNGLVHGLDEPWKILLYELLLKEFDTFYEYEINRKISKKTYALS